MHRNARQVSAMPEIPWDFRDGPVIAGTDRRVAAQDISRRGQRRVHPGGRCPSGPLESLIAVPRPYSAVQPGRTNDMPTAGGVTSAGLSPPAALPDAPVGAGVASGTGQTDPADAIGVRTVLNMSVHRV